MEPEAPSEVTLVLRDARAGNLEAKNKVIGLVYKDLRGVAVRLLGRERRDSSLTPTTVVHETVIRLMGDAALVESPNRRFLLAASARIMRQVLVDFARRRNAGRRGGGWTKVPLERIIEDDSTHGVDVLAVHEALEELAQVSARQSHLMTLRYFSGLKVAEIAASLGVSIVTVERDWRVARTWLRKRLGDASAG